MLEKINDSEYLPTFIKIIIPAVIGVGIKIAVEMKKNSNKISWLNVLLSMVIGVGGALLFKDIVQEHFSPTYVSAGIGLIAIVSDKIAEFVIYKLNIDTFLLAITNNFFEFISKSFKK